ncbi:aldose 1-epimerase family protein [Leucobacter aridicollis]|uniref:aldose 1-epimerase family protein n=1 Tax=Leucobacter aridicollis TaxID=283878 RepID=UPI0021695420|nr:aldose 1-epimerase family protein [Leucobacter aridicollis]MCS3429205.1 aldose 1-epimerase [Leucobacter aridicollis]
MSEELADVGAEIREGSSTILAYGEAYSLRHGDVEAEIVSIGASLRRLRVRGRDLVVPFGADETRPAYRGALLAPWPNRIVKGVYRYGDREYRVPINEPSRGHALHGLLAWHRFLPVEGAAASAPSRTLSDTELTLEAVIDPSDGYPWRVRVRSTFTLDEAGLTQRVTAINESDTEAPWGTGPHPYLRAPSGTLDSWTLELPAASVLEVSEPGLAPLSVAPVDAVDASRFDFRTPRQIGAAQIDHAFTDLVWDSEDLATVALTDQNGDGVEMTWGPGCPWVQIHTADLSVPECTRIGLAVEPMTCSPDAFNDHDYGFETGLVRLAPGGAHQVSWRIRARSSGNSNE